jgi:NitT/TauT family transport system substrate-binding protein
MTALVSPLALKMFEQDGQRIRWLGLAHRDGNALAINGIFASEMKLSEAREQRKPDDEFIKAVKKLKSQGKAPPIVGFPDEYATHRLIFLKYLSDRGNPLSLGSFGDGNSKYDLVTKAVFPARVLDFLKVETGYGNAVAFEQSLPWAEEIEAEKYGKVVWYSKDVMKDPKGHVECVILASARALSEKKAAIGEVMTAIHNAAKELDRAIHGDGVELTKIATMLHNEYVPAHSVAAILRALDKRVEAINYRDLNVDKPGMSVIMNLAIKAKLIQAPLDLDKFADTSFDEK